MSDAPYFHVRVTPREGGDEEVKLDMDHETLGPTLDGPRLHLRAPKPSDRDDRQQLGRVPEIARSFGSDSGMALDVLSDEAADAFYADLLREPLTWVIEYEGQFVGLVRLAGLDELAAKARLSIGIFDPAALGIGLGREAIRLVVQHAFETLSLHRLSLRVASYNERAIRCYLACGFVIEGRERDAVLSDGERHDDIIMGIVRGSSDVGRIVAGTKLPRVKALAAIRHPVTDRYLVSLAEDPTTGEPFARMLGGHVEFGESGRDTVVRELREELGASVTDVRWFGSLENHFEYDGEMGHEIVMIFTATLQDSNLYDRESLMVTEGQHQLIATWESLKDLDGHGVPMYPAGVRDLLEPSAPGSEPDNERDVIDKVVAYIVHDGQLAVFTHREPEPLVQSGLQVPAGTVQPGEPPEQAVLREASEETGLSGLYVDRFVGTSNYDMRPAGNGVHRRHFYLLRLLTTPPPTWTFDPAPEANEHGPMTFDFRWIPVAHGHILAGGLGAMIGAITSQGHGRV